MFKNIPEHIDKNRSAMMQAGISNLEKYSQVAEMITLMNEFNCNDKEVFHLDDQLVTFVLLYKKENSNFERRFAEILSKKK